MIAPQFQSFLLHILSQQPQTVKLGIRCLTIHNFLEQNPLSVEKTVNMLFVTLLTCCVFFILVNECSSIATTAAASLDHSRKPNFCCLWWHWRWKLGVNCQISKLLAHVEVLLLLVRCQEPENELCRKPMHVQIVCDGRLADSITDSNHVTGFMDGSTTVLTNDLSNLFDIFRGCGGAWTFRVLVIFNWLLSPPKMQVPCKTLHAA